MFTSTVIVYIPAGLRSRCSQHNLETLITPAANLFTLLGGTAAHGHAATAAHGMTNN
jgi:hypothetical protein